MQVVIIESIWFRSGADEVTSSAPEPFKWSHGVAVGASVSTSSPLLLLLLMQLSSDGMLPRARTWNPSILFVE